MKQTEFIPSSDMKCPKSEILLTNIGWGESGKAILQVSIAVFSGALKIFFWAKDGSAPLEKIGQYAYASPL